MSGMRERGNKIRQFIIDNLLTHPTNICSLTSKRFNISRQAANQHIQKLIKTKVIEKRVVQKNIIYALITKNITLKQYPMSEKLDENEIWKNDISIHLKSIPVNQYQICQHGFTEIFNNAIEHSDGTQIKVILSADAAGYYIRIHDNGIGIFTKIKMQFNLPDEHHSILELAKGKLTTDPKNHTGEGIFFTSRMFDYFVIHSNDFSFSHTRNANDYLFDGQRHGIKGTLVIMFIKNNNTTTTKEIFDQFSSDDDYSFDKTIVPVKLAQYDNDLLVSRSQAKRLLSRVDKFKRIIFDFQGVESIGQAFADQIFRVFANEHPDLEIKTANTSKNVKQMIVRALSGTED